MKKFWAIFFMLSAVAAVALYAVAPYRNWWFPSEAFSTLGRRIDDLFYLIHIIVSVTFVGTQIALGYVLWKGATIDDDTKAWYSHGSHKLEVVWTIVPAGILLFIALYQMDVWAEYRVSSSFPEETKLGPVAEVTARQFEWRIRYPGPGRKFKDQADADNWIRNPEPTDVYTVNDLHVPVGRPSLIQLRTDDVQHSFFSPELRVKQDAVPKLVIPVWFEVTERGEYTLLCAELCGWGHYKMKARIVAEPDSEFETYLQELSDAQNEDGFPETNAEVAEEEQ